MGEVEWGPAIAFLAGGIVIGAFILWRFVQRAPKAPPPAPGESLEQRDLRARFQALIAQLRELEDTGVKRTEAQRQEERIELELQAARTLLALDALASPAGKGRKKGRAEAGATGDAVGEAALSPASPAPSRGSSLAGFFWGIGTATAVGLLLLFVSQASKERAPGASVTGNTPTEGGGGGEAGGGPDDGRAAEIGALQARVRQNPEDVGARLDLARLHLIREDMMAVFNETQAVLQRDPGNARALTYQSLVRLAMGQGDRAEEMLIQALQKDPDLLEGYMHLMFVYTRRGKPEQADATMKRAAVRFPERAKALRELLTQMQATASEAPAADGSGDDPHAGVGVPGRAPSAAAAAARPSAPGDSARSVAGVIDLDPAARGALGPGTVLFVTLREAGFGAGPPMAALRLVPSSFPLAFQIGQADSMRGDPLPDSVLVEARLDSDGDPITRPRSDPYGRQDDVKIGTRDLRLTLSPRPEN
jgi:tetratricopeptide (TPR) repeat protein